MEFDWPSMADRVALRIVLVVEVGDPLRDQWTWQQLVDGDAPHWIHEGPPLWLIEPEMLWRDPLLPVEVRALVPAGMEDAARLLLEAGR